MCIPITVILTKFVSCTPDGTEEPATWGYTLDDDFGSYFYDGFESLAEGADAVSTKNLLATIGKHHPHFLDDIAHEGGLMLQGSWIDIEELEPELANG